jgi:beta-lactamase class A
VDLRRGVEDELAFQHDINNRVTASGLVGLLRLIGEERAFSPELSRQMLDVLLAQHFKSGIPAGLPREARVAHKTGDISTIAHDAGLVYLPGRKPYALAVLTEWDPSTTGRSATIAAASYIAYAALIGDRD